MRTKSHYYPYQNSLCYNFMNGAGAEFLSRDKHIKGKGTKGAKFIACYARWIGFWLIIRIPAASIDSYYIHLYSP